MEPVATNPGEVFAIRHGETAWSRSGRHTGATNVALTANGRAAAQALRPILESARFRLVSSSPLQRARVTCELAGFGDRMHIDHDLLEWSYGDFEGLTPDEIEQRAPGWRLFRDGCPGGESPGQVAARVDRLIARVRSAPGNVALFAHGHLLRVFVARWLGFSAEHAMHFLLDTSTLSILGYYRGIPAVKCWNAAFTDERTIP